MFFRKGFIYANILCSEKCLVNSFVGRNRSLYRKPQCVMQISFLKTNCSFLNNNNLNESFLEIGLPENDLKEILGTYPEIEKINVLKARQCIDSLMKCQFGEDSLKKLLRRNPFVLHLESKKIEEVFVNLSAKFTKPLVYKIFFNSPEVFNDSVSQIMAKVNYLEERMFVSKGQIANSGALSHPLDYIKLRHVFLERAGIFKKVDQKLVPHEKHKINPNISDILNLSDDEFPVKLAGLSIQEFEVFQDIFNPESDEDFS